MPKNSNKVSQLVSQMREDYFNVRGENPSSLATWYTDYLQVFKTLPQSRVLTESILRASILSTTANSKSRRRFVLACSKLADFAGIDHSLRRLVGKYSTKKVSPREVPDDETISNLFTTIPSDEWQFVYGLMATYGLRNCEVFLADFSQFPVLKIAPVKRGDEREVYPLYPEWVDLFGLKDGILPKCTGKHNGDIGNRVTHAFRRYKIPFSPYNLRHAWARRSLEFGMDRTIAAGMMGHSVHVHSVVYHHWLSSDVFQSAYDKAVVNPDRPNVPRLFTVKTEDKS